MIQDTKPDSRSADSSSMRWRVPAIICVLAAFSLWRSPPPSPEPPADGSAPFSGTPDVAAAEPAPGPWAWLDLSQLWRHESAAPAPVDPLVHCVGIRDAEDAYVRRSECVQLGGHADPEPVWAQSDPTEPPG